MNVFHQVFPCPQHRYLKIGNKYDVYRDKDCMKKFCEYLRKNVMNIIISKRKE